MKPFIFILVFVLSNYMLAQNDYTILRVNRSKDAQIEIGEKGSWKKRGDKFDERSKICWTNPKQSIESIYSEDGKIYTFYASNYFECKDKMKNRYLYPSYLRVHATVSKGEDNYDSTYVACTDGNDILIENLRTPIDDAHQYMLSYVGQDSIIHKASFITEYAGSSIHITKKVLDEFGVDIDETSEYCLECTDKITHNVTFWKVLLIPIY